MPVSSGIRTITSPPAQVVTNACSHIVRAHQADCPDLSRLTILVPHLQARQSIARALRVVTGAEVLLLPRITTLRLWADETNLAEPILPRAAREALLYQALSERRWFDHADLWPIVAELSGLFDELTRWHVGMPGSLAEFEIQLDRAYRARAGASFAFEARLVYELWHAAANPRGNVDAEAAYQMRLGVLARGMAEPVYAVGLGRLAPSELQFLSGCALRVATVCFVEEMSPSAALSPAEQILVRAWPEVSTAAPIQQRASELRGDSVHSGLSGRIRFYGAHGVEAEAVAVDLAVRRWLGEGRSAIGVVVLDRVTARRARALLERAEILVRDEAGWAFSTTSAATVLSRWFDVCGNDFYHRDLLDLLKSPFAFCDWNRDARQQAVWRLERVLRAANVRAGLEHYLALAQEDSDAPWRQILLRVQRAARMLDRGRAKSLAQWLGAVEASTKEIGVHTGLEADEAGSQLLELLCHLRAELSSNAHRIGFGEFRRWFAGRLESATFQDRGIDSPVVFTSLAASRLRRFDAVLVVGADATHLPGDYTPGLFFNQSVRREMGLPGRAEDIRAAEECLFALIANAERVLVTWQRTRDGEANLLSPMLERLRALHTLAWGDSLDDDEVVLLMKRLTEEENCGTASSSTVCPAPRAAAECVPSKLSASAYNTLMACPYQFFARYVLRLRESDEVSEEIDKADYGSRIHAILQQFHRTHPHLRELTAEAAQAALEKLSQDVFRDLVAVDYLASAWLVRWQALIPHYVEWQRAREADGWRFLAGEVDRSIRITTPAGRALELRGRIDRVDRREGDREVSVVDYKTQARERLVDKLRVDGEDVQLPMYALLWGGPIAAALFLSLDQKEVNPVPLDRDIEALAQEVRDRIARLFDRISEGAPLPANGVDHVCQYCEMGGLCRRKHWS